MEELIAYLNSIRPMSEELVNHLRSTLQTKVLKKKEMLLKEGSVCSHIYFIEKGLLRCYYEKHDAEVTSWLMTEGNIIVSVSSFFKQIPSRESIVALEETVLHGISYEELDYINNTFLEFNYHGRVLSQLYYTRWDERLYSNTMERAYEKYHNLMATDPEIFARVSAKYIASYLGIAEETLSRIKAQYN